MSDPLKFAGYGIVFQEVPEEVSLVINVCGCPYRCTGCHSKFLQDYDGLLLDKHIDSLLHDYGKLVTCICFMGGDQNPLELLKHCLLAKKNRLKTCLYTGTDKLEKIPKYLLDILDYVKIGPYISELGGLKNKTTNQIFYEKSGDSFIDSTYKFWREKDDVSKNVGKSAEDPDN